MVLALKGLKVEWRNPKIDWEHDRDLSQGLWEGEKTAEVYREKACCRGAIGWI